MLLCPEKFLMLSFKPDKFLLYDLEPLEAGGDATNFRLKIGLALQSIRKFLLAPLQFFHLSIEAIDLLAQGVKFLANRLTLCEEFCPLSCPILFRERAEADRTHGTNLVQACQLCSQILQLFPKLLAERHELGLLCAQI